MTESEFLDMANEVRQRASAIAPDFDWNPDSIALCAIFKSRNRLSRVTAALHQIEVPAEGAWRPDLAGTYQPVSMMEIPDEARMTAFIVGTGDPGSNQILMMEDRND